MQFEVSDQERQLIEILREWAGSETDYRLEIRHTDGAYEIELSFPGNMARGVGATLDEAWENVEPSWA